MKKQNWNKSFKPAIWAALCSVILVSGMNVYAEEMETPETTVPNGGVERIYEAEKCFTAEPLTLDPEVEIEIGSGTVTEENSVYEYQYTAPRDGRYYIDLTDVNPNCYVSAYIYDSLGNEVLEVWGQGGDSGMAILEENENYTIEVCRYQNYNSDFKISITPQKESTDISDLSEIHDQISFADQANYYTFTAKVSGAYNFAIENQTANASFDIAVFDPYDVDISDYDSGAATLEADTEYRIRVYQDSGIGSYTLHVYQQKETAEVSGYTQIDDSIEFKSQRNKYLFEAPVSGTYVFQLSNLREKYEPQFILFDEAKEVLACNISGMSEPYEHLAAYDSGIELTAGQTYEIRVCEDGPGMNGGAGAGDYSITITYPEDAASWLEEFGSGNETAAPSDAGETEAAAGEESNTSNAEIERLQEENEELRQELEDIKDLLENNGIITD